MKIGMYTENEILEHLTEGEGRGFLGRSMYDAIFDKIHALITENQQLKKQLHKAITLLQLAQMNDDIDWGDINTVINILKGGLNE